MKNTMRNLLIFLIILFSFILLLGVVRAVPGNPSLNFIYNTLRSEGKPFELSPERSRYALVLSAALDHSLIFSKSLALLALPDLGLINGNFVSLFAPGVSFFAVPLFIVGNHFGLAQFFTFATSSLFALFDLVLILLIVKKLTGNIFAGVISGLVFTFGTNAFAYSGSLYEHHYTVFFILLSIFTILHKRNWTRDFIIGIICGISFFIEYPNGLFLLPIGIWLIGMHVHFVTLKDKTRVSIYLSILFAAIGLFIGLLPTAVYDKMANGSITQLAATVPDINNETQLTMPPSKMYAVKTATGFFHIEKMPQGLTVLLTSQNRGALFFSPVVFVGLVGFWILFKEKKKIIYLFIIELLVMLALFSMWGDPWGGWAFGPRYLIPAFALLAIGIGVAINRFGKNIVFILVFLVTFLYSLVVSTVGALTTFQLPPDSDPISLKYPSLIYLHNFNAIKNNLSPSFVYNFIFHKDGISLYSYALFILSVVILLSVTSYIGAVLFNRNHRK